MSVDADREELQRLQHDWMRAVQERDMDKLEELVGEGFRFTAIHLHPEPMSRRQWLGRATFIRRRARRGRVGPRSAAARGRRQRRFRRSTRRIFFG